MQEFLDFVKHWFDEFNRIFKKLWHFIDDNKGLFEEEAAE